MQVAYPIGTPRDARHADTSLGLQNGEHLKELCDNIWNMLATLSVKIHRIPYSYLTYINRLTVWFNAK
jgi:hypothetical protein